MVTIERHVLILTTVLPKNPLGMLSASKMHLLLLLQILISQEPKVFSPLHSWSMIERYDKHHRRTVLLPLSAKQGTVSLFSLIEHTQD